MTVARPIPSRSKRRSVRSSSPRHVRTTRFSTGRSPTICCQRRSISPRWGRPAPISRPCGSFSCGRQRPRRGFGRRWLKAIWTRRWRAPVVAIVAYDEKFYEHLPFLFPHRAIGAGFSGNAALRSAPPSRTAPCRSPISSSRCARSARHRADDRLRQCESRRRVLPRGHVKSNVLINIGYGDAEKLFPRSPRFSFDQIAKIV